MGIGARPDAPRPPPPRPREAGLDATPRGALATDTTAAPWIVARSGSIPRAGTTDTLPDCTAASLAEAARGQALALHGYDLPIALDAPRAFYAACVGIAAANTVALAASAGAVMADVARRQFVSGYEVGQPAPLTGLPATLACEQAAIASAIAALGHAWLGVTLREADMDAAQSWDVSADDGAPVGGHAVMAWDYEGLADRDVVRISTWGSWRYATWRWLRARCDEAHALVWRQFAAPGFDVGALEAEVAGWAK